MTNEDIGVEETARWFDIIEWKKTKEINNVDNYMGDLTTFS
jgi:hypothetical protein